MKISNTFNDDWFSGSNEGQLSVDVFKQNNELVIRSLAAGVNPDDLDISVHGDLLTIRGTRKNDKTISEDDWYYRECYWGGFSRSIVLPYDVSADSAKAAIKNGVLEIRIPIREKGKSVKIKWEE
ncbi:Hsp20/alpha crystallin family protein [Patescibacteria group bacterium]|nr:Hsp20/alpha crystallin family protein [Patescibacteria group bacterium]MBU1907955.1 Hsp20/alpha crystallin family protein [Patescibacteria group bacterium]